MAGLDITAITGMLQKKESQIKNAIPNLAKGLFGAIQAKKANKQIKSLMANQATYKRPEEYAQELTMRQGLASQTQLPGMGQITDNIGAASAQARGAAEKGAISSNTYMGAVGDIYSKQIAAYQDLGVQAANFQQTQKENLARTLQQGAGYSDTEWDQNKLQPWNMQMNMAQSDKQAGWANLWGGVEGQTMSANNFAGTQYAQQIMKGLQGKGTTDPSTGLPTKGIEKDLNFYT
jgi:hypothetical protein